MTTEQELVARHEALIALVQYAAIRTERDRMIRDAHDHGVPVTEIANLIGLTRQQTSRIVNGNA